MKPLCLITALLLTLTLCAQKQTYDLFSFEPPKGWTKENKSTLLTYTVTNKKNGSWARVILVKSTISKGNIETDFASEWDIFAVKEHGVNPEPLGIDTLTYNGWNVKTGLCKFPFNKDTVSMLVNTFSNGERCISFLVQSNTTTYGTELEKFIESVSLSPAVAALSPQNTPPVNNPNNPAPIANTPGLTANGFQFSTTNFDDGWTSVVQEDWVEATKGNIKVILHYPRKEEQVYYPQQDEHTRTFWNLLVAPRYKSMTDFFLYKYSTSYYPGRFASATMVDHNGRTQFVALFNKGKSGWIEVITPDKQTFVNTYGVDQPDSYFTEWDALSNLAGLNKFAVGENDLSGKWSNDFGSSTSYYSVYTGIYAGSTNYASRETFTFDRNKTYNWHIVVSTGGAGISTKVDQVKSNGNFKLLSNWQIWCSDIERKPKTYNAYFSCIKGGRILWLQDTGYGNYTSFGKIGN
jgi:hypothetical protein